MKEGSALITTTSGGVSQSVRILVGAPLSVTVPASIKNRTVRGKKIYGGYYAVLSSGE